MAPIPWEEEELRKSQQGARVIATLTLIGLVLPWILQYFGKMTKEGAVETAYICGLIVVPFIGWVIERSPEYYRFRLTTRA